MTANNTWADGRFDVAACIMAVHDLEAVDKLFLHLAQALRPGGRAVLVFDASMLPHPAPVPLGVG